MYMPVLEKDTRVLIAGSGHSVYLKEVRIRQVER
jgi:hypothetical protein